MQITDTGRAIPDAYHGTTHEAAQEINRNGFKVIPNANSLLGDGVYFFESQLGNAKDWAFYHFARGTPVAVFRATVKLGHCLDLADKEVSRIVQEFVEGFAKKTNRRLTDAAAIDLIAEKANIDTVRAIRIPNRPKPLFSGSRFTENIEIIICVRNLNSILSREMVWRGVAKGVN